MELVRRWLRRGEGRVRVPGKAAVEESSVGVTTAAELVRVMIPRRLIVVDIRITKSNFVISISLLTHSIIPYYFG